MENVNPIAKPDTLTPDEVKKWLSRAKMAQKWWHKELLPKYNTAKKRYNSGNSYSTKKRGVMSLASHMDINLLYKDIRDFVGSIFYRNPEIDLTATDYRNDQAVRNIENLEQKTNDDIKDNNELKAILRSTLVDESLAGIGAVYQDYYYNDQDAVDDMGGLILSDILGDDGNPKPKRDILTNEVKYSKILPENLIVPPWIKQYNFKTGPYFGYVDIVPLETLKQDMTLNQSVIAKLEGAEYKSLVDRETVEGTEDNVESSDDDIKHVKCFYIFIRGVDRGPMKRLVLADESNADGVALAYDDWDKGHRGFPIHALMLNEACDGFLPPSEAWILETILQIIDYLFQKMNRHLKKSSTRTFVKEGQDGLKKDHIGKIAKNIDMEIIGLSGIAPGIDIRSLIYQEVDQALGQDHVQMFEIARRIFDDLSRQPSFSQGSVINKDKTATETEAIQQADNTENGDYIDKFKDFLKDLFLDHASLIQENFQGTANLSIENKDTGEEDYRQDITKDEMAGKFNVNINVTSFLPPNKEIKRRTVLNTMAEMRAMNDILKEQGLRINARKVIREYVQNIDIPDSEDFLMEVPVRDIDQQVTDFVFKGIPPNPDELGSDYESSLKRLVEIWGDEQLMSQYEQIMPGISGQGNPEQSPLYSVILALQERMQQQQKGAGRQKIPGKEPKDLQTMAGMR